MQTRIFVACFLCVLLPLCGCSKSAPKPAAEPSASPQQPAESKRIASIDVVQATPQPFAVSAGGSGEATVHLTIRSGYHVNANPPTYSYLKATELEIAPGDGISVGRVKYPAAFNKKFLFAEKPLAVYEGETDLKAAISADKSAKPGERSLSAKLRIQACDDQVCYPPGTLNLSIPVSIK
jgi:hypothetical protein